MIFMTLMLKKPLTPNKSDWLPISPNSINTELNREVMRILKKDRWLKKLWIGVEILFVSPLGNIQKNLGRISILKLV